MTWLWRLWRWLERLKEAIDKAKAKIGTVMTDFLQRGDGDASAKRKRKG